MERFARWSAGPIVGPWDGSDWREDRLAAYIAQVSQPLGAFNEFLRGRASTGQVIVLTQKNLSRRETLQAL